MFTKIKKAINKVINRKEYEALCGREESLEFQLKSMEQKLSHSEANLRNMKTFEVGPAISETELENAIAFYQKEVEADRDDIRRLETELRDVKRALLEFE